MVDDEPDVHAVTRLSLRSLKPGGQALVLHSAYSGAEGVDVLRKNPEISVVLLDVVMETDHAGLDACRKIRDINPFVRILLQTGQPGSAPEKQTIDEYDLDGYLPKAELTSTRLYTQVRAAIRAWEQITALHRHRRHLALLHDCVVSLRSYEPLEVVLERVLETAVTICPAKLAVLLLETVGKHGDPQRILLHLSTDEDPVRTEMAVGEVVKRAARDPEGLRAEGVLVPLALHRELGHGWMYLQGAAGDSLVDAMLPMLAAHASNALYSAVAQRMLAREAQVFDEMAI